MSEAPDRQGSVIAVRESTITGCIKGFFFSPAVCTFLCQLMVVDGDRI